MPTNDASATSIADGPLQTPRAALIGTAAARLGARLEAWCDAERDQLPLWLPVGLGLGVAAWFVLPGVAAWIAFLLAAAALALAFAAAGQGRAGRALAVFALAALLGCGLVWLRSERAAGPVLPFARMVEFEGAVEKLQYLPARASVRLVIAPRGDPELPRRVRINLDEKHRDPAIAPGAVVRLKAWLMPPAPMAVPAAYDYARVAWFQGIGGSGRALGPAVLIAPATDRGLGVRIAGWRQDLAGHIASRLSGGPGAIAVALATGDQAGLSDEDAEAMRRSGLAHLLSVSGLHLTAMVGAAMLLTLKLLALSPALALRWPLVLIAAAAGALAGIAYTLLTGAEVPTIRACVAAILVLVGIALGRDALTLRLVAVGALVVLLFWPESLAGPSFQLSFAAITAIVALHEQPRVKALLARRDEGLGAKVGRFLLALLLTGLVVEVALAPIALFHFHKAGIYGALANIVAIPLTTFVIMPVEALALLLDLIGLGAPFWWLAGAALEALLGLAHAVANSPAAVGTLPSMPRAAFALIVAGGLWLALWRTPVRRWGLLPAALGIGWALATPPPDLLVTGDGRHLAVAGADGRLALLRPRAGDYVRDMLAETAGEEGDFQDIDALPAAACSADLCAVTIERSGRVWRLLATRSPHFVEIKAMVRACAAADIVVSDRRLPRTCTPRWLKLDRDLLRRTGGVAIRLGERPGVATVAGRTRGHPWALIG